MSKLLIITIVVNRPSAAVRARGGVNRASVELRQLRKLGGRESTSSGHASFRGRELTSADHASSGVVRIQPWPNSGSCASFGGHESPPAAVRAPGGRESSFGGCLSFGGRESTSSGRASSGVGRIDLLPNFDGQAPTSRRGRTSGQAPATNGRAARTGMRGNSGT
jgi:hypothetical protein